VLILQRLHTSWRYLGESFRSSRSGPATDPLLNLLRPPGNGVRPQQDWLGKVLVSNPASQGRAVGNNAGIDKITKTNQFEFLDFLAVHCHVPIFSHVTGGSARREKGGKGGKNDEGERGESISGVSAAVRLRGSLYLGEGCNRWRWAKIDRTEG